MRALVSAIALALLAVVGDNACAQTSTLNYVVNGNTSTGGLINAPVGTCTTCVSMPVTGTITPSAVTLSTASTSALAANLVVKAAAGSLYSFEVSADATLSGAAWWLMIYNATTAPADGAVTPVKCFAFPSGTTSFFAAFPVPIALSTGITLGVSTNGCFTKAASAHAFISGDYQ